MSTATSAEPAAFRSPETEPMPKSDPEGAPPVSKLLIALLRPIHTLFVPFWYRIKVRHRNRIPKKGPIILTPTHRSRWDPMIMPWLTLRLLRSMASHDEFKGLQGWFMQKLGAFPVDTRRPSVGTLRDCTEVLKAGQVLVIYPEGNIFRDPPGHVHPIKPGTAWIALKSLEMLGDSSLKIIPIRIQYGSPIPKFRDRLEVEIREPITVADFLHVPEREAIRELTAAIQAGMGDVVDTSPKVRDAPQAQPTSPETNGPEPVTSSTAPAPDAASAPTAPI